MTLDEKVDYLDRVGLCHVFEVELYEFGRRCAERGIGYIAQWDNGLKCYYVEKQEAVDLGEVH